MGKTGWDNSRVSTKKHNAMCAEVEFCLQRAVGGKRNDSLSSEERFPRWHPELTFQDQKVQSKKEEK